MGATRGMLRVLAGLIFALLVAGLVQVLFVVTPADLYAVPAADRAERLGGVGVLALLAATHSATFALPFALLVTAIGEWLRLRGWLYYALGGMVIALCGFAAQYASENGPVTIVNDYALKAFLTTGFGAGLVYWLVSGRRAGTDERAADDAA